MLKEKTVKRVSIASNKSVGRGTDGSSEGNNNQVEPWQMKWFLPRPWDFYLFHLDCSQSLSMTYSKVWGGNARWKPLIGNQRKGKLLIVVDCYVKGPQWITSGIHSLILSPPTLTHQQTHQLNIVAWMNPLQKNHPANPQNHEQIKVWFLIY